MSKENITLLESVKISLGRTKESRLDVNLEELISSAKLDLKLAGLIKTEEDPLIVQCIKLYCRANTTMDDRESRRSLESYENLKNKLSLAKEYKDV